MRRLLFILTAFYLVFIGGSAYFNFVPAVRYFHHIFVTLLLAVWLFDRIRTNQGLPQTPLNLPIFAVIVVWFVSAILSIYPRMAFENLWFPLTHVVLFFILTDVFQRGRYKLVLETQFILAALVIFITGLEVASWYFGLGIIPGTEIGWAQVGGVPLTAPRVALAMNISTLLAGYVAPVITIAAAWALTTRVRAQRIVLWGLAILLAIVLILTFSRGGLLSLGVAVSVLIIARLAQTRFFTGRLAPRLLIAAAIVAGIAVMVLFMVYTASQDRRSGDEGRVDMWLSAVAMTRDYPVLGVGPGLYGRAFRVYRDTSIARDKLASAHNAYLNTAAETGIVGVVVSLWLLAALIRGWWLTWRRAATTSEKLRLEAALAALLGVGVHSLVDTFTGTPIILILIGLAAYCVCGQRSQLETPPAGQRLPAVIGLVLILGYGVWFVLQVDSAYGHYLNSIQGDPAARLQSAQTAAQIDPTLNLYPLQVAYLTGLGEDTTEAISLYQAALKLEPTWDVGWINLAKLLERQGDYAGAFNALTEAQRINPLTAAPLYRAQLAEAHNLLPRTAIITTYAIAIENVVSQGILPTVVFWTTTPVRQEGLERYLQTAPLEIQYRVYSIIDPVLAASLVPDNPVTAEAWWVVAESTNDPDALSRAIVLDPANGDYYAARALINPPTAERDLMLAYLLGTTFESPETRRLVALNSPQEFAAVLYGGRISVFSLMP